MKHYPSACLLLAGSFMGRLRRNQPRALYWRRGVQALFVAIVLWVGVRFALFVEAARRGEAVRLSRPPGVESFLPISGMLGLRHWLASGSLNTIHPAAVVLFLVAVATAVVARRAFCAWVCPVGSLSEGLASLGKRLFGRNLVLPRWLDIPLRGLKYLFLAFFLWIVFVVPTRGLAAFLYGDYNRVADVKMYLFFREIGPGALAVVVGLVGGSLLVRHLWCRYLCPYGALLGLVALVSPNRIRRDPDQCAGCRACTEACPQLLPVHDRLAIRSAECTACQSCVDACPTPTTLTFGLRRRRGLPPWAVAAAVVACFAVGIGVARLTGHWQSAVATGEYVARMPWIDQIDHVGAAMGGETGGVKRVDTP